MRSSGARFSRAVWLVPVALGGLFAACSGSVVVDPGAPGNGGATSTAGVGQSGPGPSTGSFAVTATGSGPVTSVGVTVTVGSTTDVGSGPQTTTSGFGGFGAGGGFNQAAVSVSVTGAGGGFGATTGSFGGGFAVSSSSFAVATGSGSGFAVAVSSSGVGGGTGCEASGNCDACQSCAWFGPCTTDATACQNSSGCVSIMQCEQSCAQGDEACYTKCYWTYPQGQPAYDALLLCIDCSQCYDVCGGEMVGCPPAP
jgi:hypothetical protein